MKPMIYSKVVEYIIEQCCVEYLQGHRRRPSNEVKNIRGLSVNEEYCSGQTSDHFEPAPFSTR